MASNLILGHFSFMPQDKEAFALFFGQVSNAEHFIKRLFL